jgi:hypothetical protein
MAINRRLPVGYGQTTGTDAYIRNAESQALRAALTPREGGWLITTVGENIMTHHDVTGVLMTADRLLLMYVPARTSAVKVAEARINVATAVAATTVETALFYYENQVFKRIPGTYAIFNSASTGLKTKLLDIADVLPDTKVFIGIVAHGGTPALEGFQSGAGGSPRVILQRSISSITALGSRYELAQTSTNTGDSPMVGYLSNQAALVL